MSTNKKITIFDEIYDYMNEFIRNFNIIFEFYFNELFEWIDSLISIIPIANDPDTLSKLAIYTIYSFVLFYLFISSIGPVIYSTKSPNASSSNNWNSSKLIDINNSYNNIINNTINNLINKQNDTNNRIYNIQIKSDSLSKLLVDVVDNINTINSQKNEIIKFQDLLHSRLNNLPNLTDLNNHIDIYYNRISNIQNKLIYLSDQQNKFSSIINSGIYHMINQTKFLSHSVESLKRDIKDIERKYEDSISKEKQLTTKILNEYNDEYIKAFINNFISTEISKNNNSLDNSQQNVITYRYRYKSEITIAAINYANYEIGARIVHSLTSSTYFPIEHTRLINQFVNIPTLSTAIASLMKSFYEVMRLDSGVGVPEDLLKNDLTPGSCWPMKGENGYVTVMLPHIIDISSVSINHISKSQAYDIKSALKDFIIFASLDIDGPYESIIEGSYDINNSSNRQSFSALYPMYGQYVKLQVLNNFGHEFYTCIYQFEVHGNL